jgi:biopolymer transport protein ExbB
MVWTVSSSGARHGLRSAFLALALIVAGAGVAQAQAPNPVAPPAASASAAPSTDQTAQPSAAPAPAQASATGNTPSAPPQAVNAALPRDLSPWGMFINADIVVKAIMIGLLFASLVTWTVWLAKVIELTSAKRQVMAGLLKLQEARSLSDAERKFGDADDNVAKLVRTASAEVAMSDHTSGEGLKERVSWLLERLEVAAGRRIGRGMGVLASIGATAPFVGLLGTVWGIMNSFIGISNAHTTNLAVVAPGIAEALLATALGLFAAIPAVVIYNVFARSAAGYRMLVADAGALVLRLVSRDSERSALPLSRAAE